MSISAALSNALSGLTAGARAANVVSSNLANLTTEGYGRRDIELGAQTGGNRQGVRVLAVTRHVDQGVLADRRLADGALAHAQTRAQFLTQVQDAIGTPDQPGALSARIAAFEASLVTAASRPDATERLDAVVRRAGEVASAFNDISSEIQKRRMDAEQAIEQGVAGLNGALDEVHGLNRLIADATQRGHATAALLDERQRVVDRIADLVPVQEIPRDRGQIALISETGAVLLDGMPARLEFTRANAVMPHMRQDNGMLAGVTLNGENAGAAGPRNPLAGGRLAALFEIRDDLAVDAQAQVDALARDLAERFQQPGLDPSLTAGDPGLFTDGGAQVTATAETGLAGRLSVNARVDPANGGAAWRLRDGLGATSPGPAGEARLLSAQLEAMTNRQVMASGRLTTGAGTLADHAAALASHAAQSRLTGERASSFAAVRQDSLHAMLLRDGVDSDAETQRLLVIEQAYAANARMIQTLDDMMQTLLRI